MSESNHEQEQTHKPSLQALGIVSLGVAVLAFPGCWLAVLTAIDRAMGSGEPAAGFGGGWVTIALFAIMAAATLLPIFVIARLYAVRPATGAEVPAWTALALMGFWWVMIIVFLGISVPV